MQDTRTPSTDTECTCGCNWTQSLPQALIGGLSDKGVTYVVTDAFHDVRDTGTLCSLCVLWPRHSQPAIDAVSCLCMAEPYHHAHLWNNCSIDEVTGGQCVLNLTTVSQLIYPITDSSDSGFQPSSAADIRVKMKSRQVIYMVRDDALGESSRHEDSTFT